MKTLLLTLILSTTIEYDHYNRIVPPPTKETEPEVVRIYLGNKTPASNETVYDAYGRIVN